MVHPVLEEGTASYFAGTGYSIVGSAGTPAYLVRRGKANVRLAVDQREARMMGRMVEGVVQSQLGGSIEVWAGGRWCLHRTWKG